MNFRELILDREFEEARKMLNKITDFDEKIIDYAFDDDNIVYYDFYKFVLDSNNSAKLNWGISKLLSTAFCYLDNAYENAYEYLKKAIELDSNNYDYYAHQISFYSLPVDEPIINKNELIQIFINIKRMKKEDKEIDVFINSYLSKEEKEDVYKNV